MALIHCPECGRKISDNTKLCPGCGYKLKKQKKERRFLKTRLQKIIFIVIVVAILLCVLGVGWYYGYTNYIVPNNQYKKAVRYEKQEKYEDAMEIFQKLGTYKDSQTKIKDVKYHWADKVDIDKSIALYEEIGDYKDAKEKLAEAQKKKEASEALERLSSAYENCTSSGTTMASDGMSISVDSSSQYDLDATADIITIISCLKLPDSLFDEMCETNALMGRQTESYNYYDVSWSYHPDNGLDVIFKYKNEI